MAAEKPKHRDPRATLRSKCHRCTIPGCDKAFTRLSHLQRHALNHSQTQWVCTRCNAPFKRLDLLERHKARHSIRDSLAGGSGLGILQTRRKTIPGALFARDISDSSPPPLDNGKDTTMSLSPLNTNQENLDQSKNTVAGNGREITSGIELGNHNNVGVSLPELPVSILDGADMTTISSPSINLCELGNMYYDTNFDSVHFDVMGFSCSPPQTSPDISQGSDGIETNNAGEDLQTLPFRCSPGSMNWDDTQSPLPAMTIEGPEFDAVSGLQRSMDLTNLLNDSSLLQTRVNKSRRQRLEKPIQDIVQQTANRRDEEDITTRPRKEWELELLPGKRIEILELLTEIRPVYPNGSLVDGKTSELSFQSMQEYLDMFLQYFNSTYPMVHIPTLDITTAEPILLLSMITLGATYKNKDSHQLSVCLYDAIVPYILSGLMSIPIPDLSTLQAFLILECYGMYRAGPYQRENAILVHTLLFSAIRRVSRYHVRGGIMLPNHLTDQDAGWKEFAYAEQYKRLILFVFMWDTQNVSCYSFMPSMSTHTIQVRLPCTQEIWNARTEPAWREAMDSHPLPPNFDDTVKRLVEDGDSQQIDHPLDGLSLTFVLHGLMSMCNDMVHFDNRSIYLGDLEKGEPSWAPWRRRMTHALQTWKAQYDAYTMTAVLGMHDQENTQAYANYQKESVALLALYHTAHIVINCEIRHLQAAAGMKAIFGHIVTSADRAESTQWVKRWMRTHSDAANHAAWHAAQTFREGLLHLKNWDTNDVFHYPWCLVIGTLTCWAFHSFGADDMGPLVCTHQEGTHMGQEQSRALMNHVVSLMASVSPTDLRRTLRKCCTHGLASEVARYLKSVRWTAAFEAMKLLETLSAIT